MTGPLVLLLTSLVGFGNKLSTGSLLVLFESVAIIVAIGFAATILIINRPEIRHLNAGLVDKMKQSWKWTHDDDDDDDALP